MKSLLLPVFALGLLAVGPAAAQTAEKKSTAPKPPRALDAMIIGDQLWDTGATAFEAAFKAARLQWLSANKDQARFSGEGLELFGGEIKLLEAIAEFQNEKLARVNLSLFNQGDSKDVPANAAEFDKMISGYKDILTAHLGVKPVDRGKDAASAVKAIGFMWVKPPTAYLLEYSFQKEMKALGKEFRADFVRLRVAPVPKPALIGTSSNAGNRPVAKASLTANVTKDPNGDVVIKGIPMVDQGPKGYCVVASAERVFKYLGLDVDQHEMAAVADSSATGGTSPSHMVDSLKKLTGRLKVHIRELQPWKFDEFQRMVADYNRAAKRNKKHEVNLDTSRVIDIGEIYASFDPDALKETRATPTKASYTKFQRQVADTVNKGVPVMWSCELGIYPESERTSQTHGGHMRLIIGYNLKTNEVLFSDSWGAKHELKRMPMDNACAMTTGLYYLEPIQ